MTWHPDTPRSAVTCAAETARSVLEAATTLALHLDTVPGLVVVGGHGGDDAGRLLVPTSADCRVLAAVRASGAVPARAVLTDVAPLPVRDRVRARLVLRGALTELAGPAVGPAAAAWTAATGRELDGRRRLLQLAPTSVSVVAGGEVVEVCPHLYGQARPDPLARHEAEVLSHLAAGHGDLLERVPRLLPRRAVAGARRVVPLRLTRHALVLRVERDRGDTDVPVALASARATHPGEVLVALRALLDTADARTR